MTATPDESLTLAKQPPLTSIEEFERILIARLQQRMPECYLDITNHELHFQHGDRAMDVDISEFYSQYRHAPEVDPDVITHIVNTFAAIKDVTISDFDHDSNRLLPRIISVNAHRAGHGTEQGVLRRHFDGDVDVAVSLLIGERQVTFISLQHLGLWGVSEEFVWKTAMENLAKLPPIRRITDTVLPRRQPVLHIQVDDPYVLERLFLPKVIRQVRAHLQAKFPHSAKLPLFWACPTMLNALISPAVGRRDLEFWRDFLRDEMKRAEPLTMEWYPIPEKGLQLPEPDLTP